jgi:hypothetical protein
MSGTISNEGRGKSVSQSVSRREREREKSVTDPLVTEIKFRKGIFLPGLDILVEVSFKMKLSQSEVKKRWRGFAVPFT